MVRPSPFKETFPGFHLCVLLSALWDHVRSMGLCRGASTTWWSVILQEAEPKQHQSKKQSDHHLFTLLSSVMSFTANAKLSALGVSDYQPCCSACSITSGWAACSPLHNIPHPLWLLTLRTLGMIFPSLPGLCCIRLDTEGELYKTLDSQCHPAKICRSMQQEPTVRLQL